jgi:hypothetical protein
MSGRHFNAPEDEHRECTAGKVKTLEKTKWMLQVGYAGIRCLETEDRILSLIRNLGLFFVLL